MQPRNGSKIDARGTGSFAEKIGADSIAEQTNERWDTERRRYHAGITRPGCYGYTCSVTFLGDTATHHFRPSCRTSDSERDTCADDRVLRKRVLFFIHKTQSSRANIVEQFIYTSVPVFPMRDHVGTTRVINVSASMRSPNSCSPHRPP